MLVGTGSKGGLCYPVTPVEVQIALQEVSHTAVMDIEMTPLLPDVEFCVITTMSQTGRTDKEERHRGSRGRGEEPRAGREEVDQDSAHGVET